MKRTLTLATMITLGAAAWLPLPSMAQTGLSLTINSAPPAPRFESVPAARRGHVWAPGYWNYDNGRHVWLGGHWEAERNGYQYQSGEWVRDGGGYRLRAGGWQPMAQQVRYDEIRIAPPAPRYERIPRARDGYVWQPGYWNWRGNRHEWSSGIWVTARPGYNYSSPQWVQRDGRWFMEQSRWTPRGRDRDRDGIPDRFEHGRDRDRDGVPDRLEHRRDRDRDGIPDRYEGRRDQDGDGVSDRRDADRDGDGVRNGRDDRPDNPHRN